MPTPEENRQLAIEVVRCIISPQMLGMVTDNVDVKIDRVLEVYDKALAAIEKRYGAGQRASSLS